MRRSVHTYADKSGERWNDRGDPLYSAEWRFLYSLLRDPAVRTLDPYAADLFFVPLFTSYGQTSNTDCPHTDVQVAAHHLRRTMPYFWERHGGADHVFFATGDKGFCRMEFLATDLAAKPIFVSHFGLLGGIDHMSAFEKLPAEFHKPARTLEQELESGKWIFAPHKDVVVPGVTALLSSMRMCMCMCMHVALHIAHSLHVHLARACRLLHAYCMPATLNPQRTYVQARRRQEASTRAADGITCWCTRAASGGGITGGRRW